MHSISKTKLMVLALLGCCMIVSAGPTETEIPDTAVARIDGIFITREDLGEALIPSIGPEVFNRFVKVQIINHIASGQDIQISEEDFEQRVELEVRRRLEDLYEHNRTTREEFAALLEDQGMEWEQLQNMLRDAVVEDELRTQLLIEKILVDEIDVERAELVDIFNWRYGRRIVAQHIQVQEEDLAQNILQHLQRNPDDWSAIVNQFSQDRRSMRHNGRLLPFPADSELGSAFEGKEPGDMFMHQTERGLHVMRLRNVFEPVDVDLDAVEDELKREIAVRKVERIIPEWLADLREDMDIGIPLEQQDGALLYIEGEAVKKQEFAEMLSRRFGYTYLPRVIERTVIKRHFHNTDMEMDRNLIDSRFASYSNYLFDGMAFDKGLGSEGLERVLQEDGMTKAFFKNHLGRRFLTEEGIESLLMAEKIAESHLVDRGVEENRLREVYHSPRLTVQRLVRNDGEEAQQLKRTAEQEGDFPRLVLLESDDPLAWKSCGIITDVTSEELYFDKVKDLEPGAFSQVFEQNGEYVFLRLLGKNDVAVEDEDIEKIMLWYRRREANRAVNAMIEELKLNIDLEIYN